MIIEIFQDKKKEYRFRLKSRNGKTLAQSEGYTRKFNAVKTSNLISNMILDGRPAIIKDLTL